MIEEEVRCLVARDLEIEPGMVLPPGTYAGTRQELHFQGRLVDTRYSLDLSADQLRSMGAWDLHPDLVSESWDVTKFVRSGDILVRMPLFWLQFPNGCAIVPASDAMAARRKAALAGLYPGGLCSATPLDDVSEAVVTKDIMGRVLRGEECREILRRLEAAHVEKRPPAPSVRRRAARKRKAGSSGGDTLPF